MEQIVQMIYRQAQLLGVCSLFTGKERTLEEIVKIFNTPQGIEFCIKNHFPNMATFRLLKPYNLERFGIYVDAGSISLKNPTKAIIIGNTAAVINCDTIEQGHSIILMQGASAIINASKWAVCTTTIERGCNIICNTSDNAIIL